MTAINFLTWVAVGTLVAGVIAATVIIVIAAALRDKPRKSHKR